jgi:hypothetical protein
MRKLECGEVEEAIRLHRHTVTSDMRADKLNGVGE